MCDFRYPYYIGGTRVNYVGNVDNVKVDKIGCYSVGHTGSFTFYWDGQSTYRPDDVLPIDLYWNDECPWSVK